MRTEIYTMSGGYYFVIRNKFGKMIKSSNIYMTKQLARKKAQEWKKKHKKEK